MKQRDREMRAGMDRGARRRVLWLCGAVLAFGAGCVGAPESLPPCTSANSPDSFCGLANPEDLDLLPGGWMVVSQMGSADRAGRRSSEQGSLLAIRLVDGKRQLLGEDGIGHTPRNETITLTVGKAFDVVAERVRKDYRRVGDRVHRTEW